MLYFAGFCFEMKLVNKDWSFVITESSHFHYVHVYIEVMCILGLCAHLRFVYTWALRTMGLCVQWGFVYNRAMYTLGLCVH